MRGGRGVLLCWQSVIATGGGESSHGSGSHTSAPLAAMEPDASALMRPTAARGQIAAALRPIARLARYVAESMGCGRGGRGGGGRVVMAVEVVERAEERAAAVAGRLAAEAGPIAAFCALGERARACRRLSPPISARARRPAPVPQRRSRNKTNAGFAMSCMYGCMYGCM